MQQYNWHDTLDEDFIKIFAPFRTIQIIMGSCRVHIQDRIVTAPTRYQKCYTIICFIAATYFDRSCLLKYAESFYSDPQMVSIFVIGLSTLHFLFSLSIIHARFINKGNIKLYKKMQKVDRIMKLSWLDSGKLRIKHHQRNRLIVLSLITTFAVLTWLAYYMTRGIFEIHQLLGLNWAVLAYVLEMGCCSSHIIFFTTRTNLINSIIENHLTKECFGEGTSTKYSTIGRQDYESCETDVYLKEIFCAFTCFQNQYRFQVFLFGFFFISWWVVSFRYIILALQSSVALNILILDFVHIITMAVLSICMLLWLSIRSELFSREVKKTKKLSNSILSRYFDGPLRQKAMRMLKLIEHEPPRFCVYGMWHMDARLLLNMFTITTSAFVIILQFAFS